MAPAEPPVYFPPLDKCLEEGAQLFSWTDIFSVIVDGQNPLDEAVSRFLQDPDTRRALRHAFTDLPTPTNASRADFDQRTAAINITPSQNGGYDLSEIKEDSLWLSKEAQIEELLALRIVTLELNSRPMKSVWNGAAAFEDTRLALGQNNGVVDGKAQQVNKTGKEPNNKSERRQALLQLFLRERGSLSAVAQSVVSAALHSNCFESTAGRPPKANYVPSAVEDCGNSIVNAWELGSRSPRRSFVLRAVEFFESRLRHLAQPGGLLQEDPASEELELLRQKILLTEMVHVLQTIFTVIDWSSKTPSAEVLDSWFRLMDTCHFLNFIDTVNHPETNELSQVVQSLTAIISLAILKLPNLTLALSQASGQAPPDDEQAGQSDPYFRNVDCVARTTSCFLQAAEQEALTAGPAALAWSITFQDIADYSTMLKENREVRQAQQATDRLEADRQPDIDGVGRGSPSRRSSASSETSQPLSIFEEVTNAISNLRPNDQVLRDLASDSINVLGALNVVKMLSEGFCSDASPDRDGRFGLRVRLLFLQLLRYTQDILGYQSSTVECCVAILNGRDSFWTRFDRPYPISELEPARAFLNDLAYFKTQVWSHALARFPYETLPVLTLCQALCIPAQDMHALLEDSLEDLGVFAVRHDEREAPVELSADDDTVVLLRRDVDAMHLHFPFLKSSQARSFQGVPDDMIGSTNKFVLRAGTRGQIVTDGRPTVIAWECSYSAFAFFGIILRLAYEQRSSPRARDAGQIFTTATEVLGVLAALTSCNDSKDYQLDRELGEFVFQRTSQDFCEYQDVVSLVFELFESQLYRGSLAFNDLVVSDFLTNSIRFIHSLLLVAPHRVWPFIGRSSFLGMHGKESRLMSAVSVVPSGRHDLLISSIRLFEALVHDAVTHSGTRRIESQALTRFRPVFENAKGPGTSEATIQQVILSFTKILVDVLEGSQSWKFAVVDDRLDVNCRICNIFDEILNTYYGLDDADDESSKLTACLAPAAQYLMELLLAHSSSSLATKALLDVIVDGLTTPINTIAVGRWMMWQSQTLAALRLTTRLIRLSRYLKRASSLLERSIFDRASTLIQIYAGFPNYRIPVVDLLNSLVSGNGDTGAQPPSLLSSIGQSDMRAFVDVLSYFDRPFQRPALSQAIWKFLAVAISHRQQWLTIYLLKGKTPRQWLKKHLPPAKALSESRPMFQLALERFARIQSVAQGEALGLLEFITAAIDYSPGAMEEFKKVTKGNALLSTLRLVADLKSPSSIDTAGSKDTPQSYQLAALVVRILAMLEHYYTERHAGQEGRPTLFKSIETTQVRLFMKFLLDHGVEAPSYNSTLHKRLEQNVQSRIPSFKLIRSKRTTLNPSTLGRDFYYDIDALKMMLEKDPGWNLTFSRSITEELARANLNLSLVEAQVELFHAWKLLIGELNEEGHGRESTHNHYISIIRSCLQANAKSLSTEPYFEQLAFDRAEIALLLAQRFTQQALDDEKVIDVWHLTWVTISEYSTDLGSSLASDSAEYARRLLKLLCLLTGASAEVVSKREARNKKKDEDDINLVLTILESVASLSFRSLVRAVHDDQTKVDPADCALINTLLHCCLSFPGVEQHSDRLNEIFVDQGALRSACTLFSWADKLEIDGDPVYGEVSLTYILELSKLAALAESIMLNGVLAATLAVRLLSYLRRPGGIGPFQEPARMYSIWTRGMLPLLINLLTLVGAPAAAEVANFLALFEPQLARASGGFDLRAPPSAGAQAAGVTLTATSEAQSLALIATILDRYREAGASAGIEPGDVADLPWDRAAVRLDLESLLERRGVLRDSLVPLGEREQAWARAKPEGSDREAESKYEEMVVQDIGVILFLLGSDE